MDGLPWRKVERTSIENCVGCNNGHFHVLLEYITLVNDITDRDRKKKKKVKRRSAIFGGRVILYFILHE